MRSGPMGLAGRQSTVDDFVVSLLVGQNMALVLRSVCGKVWTARSYGGGFTVDSSRYERKSTMHCRYQSMVRG